MSKNPKLSLCIVLMVLLIGVQISAAQEAVVSPALLSHMEGIEQTTSTIRGLQPLEAIERGFPTRDDVSEYVISIFNEDLPQEEADRAMIFYAAFDMLPHDLDLRQMYIDLLISQIGGFFDTETKMMNVVMFSGNPPGDELPLLEQILYAHEYTHALQDQHYDIESLGFTTEDQFNDPDRVIAVQSLIEGDATAVMTDYTVIASQGNPMAAMQILLQGMQTGSMALPPGIPPVIEDELLFPYMAGAEFVNALRAQGGWDAVDAAYENLPQSSEHIIHPDRYLAGDAPIAVALGDTDSVLGDEWLLAWDRTMGEFYLRQYLRTQLGLRAIPVAAGWGGDRYRIYRNETTGELAWVLKFVWDTPQEADEFSEAYIDFGDARFSAMREQDCWTNDTEALCMIVTNGEHAITYAPTLELAERLLDSQR